MNNIVNLIKLTFVKMYVIDKFIHDVKNGSECCHTIIERELKKPRFYDEKNHKDLTKKIIKPCME